MRWAVLLSILILLVGAQCRSDNRQPVEPATLDIRLSAEPTTLDPVHASNDAEINVINQLFVGLTRYDPEIARAVPDLAVEWNVSEDGRTYTFDLRDDVFWVDDTGTRVSPVTADDVVYSIRRACNPATNAHFVETLFIIENCESAYTSTGIVDLEGIGVRTIDERTVEFTLHEAAAYFPILLSTTVARPQPQDVVEGHGDAWFRPENIVTNGPYLLRESLSGQKIVLTKNEEYHNANSVDIATVNVLIAPSSAEARRLYEDNQLDTTVLAPEDSQILQRIEERNDVHVRAPAPCTTIYAFTNTKPPLDNRDVRLALSQAIPRSGIARDTLQQTALPAYHFAPSGIFGAPPAGEVGAFTDPSRAADLLAQAGYPGGQGFPILTLAYLDDGSSDAVADVTTDAWQKSLGIDVNLDAQSEADLQRLVHETLPLEEMPHIWQFSWCASSLDQHMWLYEAFHCTDSPNPLRRLCTTFDTLVEQAAAEKDPEEREELYAQAEEVLAVEEAAYAPVYHHAVDIVTKPWLQRNYPILGGWDISTWSLNMQQKRTGMGTEG